MFDPPPPPPRYPLSVFPAALIADVNLAVYYNEPFWLRFTAHAAFFGGALFMAARLQADGLVRRPSWRYWQAACLFLVLWNLTQVTTAILRESVDVGTVTEASGEAVRGSLRTERYVEDGHEKTLTYSSLTEKQDPLLDGARFVPLGPRGTLYYYLQFDTVLLVVAGVFGILGLAAERARTAGTALDEVEETTEGADA